jgi:hypothetical protein
MMHLLAQTITPPSSGDFWNPMNYQWLGGDRFLVFCVLAAFAVLGYLIFSWTLGPSGCLSTAIKQITERVVSFIGTIEANSTTTTETLKKHMDSCDRIHVPGGPCNVIQMEAAAHHAAEALRNIGQGKPCDEQADAIHNVLRSGTVKE